MLVRMGGNLPEETWLQGVLEEGYREAGAEDKFPPPPPCSDWRYLSVFRKQRRLCCSCLLLLLLFPHLLLVPFFVKCGLIERGKC